jgi:hypothetical protein
VYFLKLYSRIGEGEEERRRERELCYILNLFLKVDGMWRVWGGVGEREGVSASYSTILDIAEPFRCTQFYKLWGISMS